MENLDNTGRFLYLFKEVERIVIEKSGLNSEDHISFSRALNQVYYEKNDPVLSIYENYSFLKTATDLRNLLSHENDTAIPTDQMVKKLENLYQKLVHPLTVYDICTKDVITCYESESISSAMKKMNRLGLSHFPIFNSKNELIGVFSRTSIFDAISSSIPFQVEQPISTLTKVTGFSSHLNETFLFVSKKTSIDLVFQYLNERKPYQKNVVCIFVTYSGKKEENLLGVCTIADLAKVK